MIMIVFNELVNLALLLNRVSLTGVREVESLLLAVQHRLNPLHIYCRLVDRGFSRKMSLRITRLYELLFFRWLDFLTIVSIAFCKMITSRR